MDLQTILFAGEFDLAKHQDNMREAIEVYVNTVDGTPAMGTAIKLYKGVEKSIFLSRRPDLLVFLKGTKRDRLALHNQKPERFAYFRKIWRLRSRHLVECAIPQKYAFILHCCGEKKCIHPLCKQGVSPKLWYADGPEVVSHLPLPVKSDEACVTCKGTCAGHYKADIQKMYGKRWVYGWRNCEMGLFRRNSVMRKQCVMGNQAVYLT